MRWEIRCRGVEVTAELRDYLNERLRLVLGRFSRHIGPVRAYLRDVNGPRGGPDKMCRLVVELPRRSRVIVTGTDMDLRAVIAGTVSRAGAAVKRLVKRRWARRHLLRRRGHGIPLGVQ